MKFKIGDRVRLTQNNFEDGKHDIFGKKGEEGTIIAVYNGRYTVNFDVSGRWLSADERLELVTQKLFPDELKEGEWYYTIQSGWGKCENSSSSNYPFIINGCSYTDSGKWRGDNKAPSVFLYDIFEGTPKPEEEELPKKGDLVYVWDHVGYITFGFFQEIDKDGDCVVIGEYTDEENTLSSWKHWSLKNPLS